MPICKCSYCQGKDRPLEWFDINPKTNEIFKTCNKNREYNRDRRKLPKRRAIIGMSWCNSHKTYHKLTDFSLNKQTSKLNTVCDASIRHRVKLQREYSTQHNLNLKIDAWNNYFNGRFECLYKGNIHPHTNGKEFDIRILEMHHINGDGVNHKKIIGITKASQECGTYYYRILKKLGWPEINVISLCPTHHRIIHILEENV